MSKEPNLVPVVAMALEKMENGVLAAANLALTGFQKIALQNIAYKPFLSASLIKESGQTTFDLGVVINALAYVINARVAAGTFK